MRIIKKLILAVGLVIILFFITMMVLVSMLVASNKKEQEDVEKVIGTGEKKILILYQDSVSDIVSRTLNRIMESIDESDCTITINHPRSDSTYQVSDYDLVVFLTPVYAGHISEPLQNYAKSQDFTDVNVVNIITGKREPASEIELLEGCIKNPKSMTNMKIKEPDAETIQNIHTLLMEDFYK